MRGVRIAAYAGVLGRAQQWIGRVLGIALLVGTASSGFAGPAGEILYVRGVASLTDAEGGLGLAGRGTVVSEGDTLGTGPVSFVLLRLEDGSRITVRPESEFVVEAIDTRPGAERLEMRLERGGIRARTGSVAALRPDSFHLRGGNADVRTRSAEFIARACTDDCAAAPSEARVATPVPRAIARVLVAVGNVSAERSGETRPLARGDSLELGDVVVAGPRGHIVLGFRDRTRVTVQPETRLVLAEYQLAPDTPAAERSRLRVERGGLRVSTGRIAKRNAASVRFDTPVAVIGVRGTGFDLVEAAECGGTSAPPSRPGLTASVWEGAIAIEESNRVVENGETVCVLEPGGPVVPVANRPQLDTPRPDEVEMADDLFATETIDGGEPGLHVAVIEGDLALVSDDRSLSMAAGEDGFSGSGPGASGPVRVQSDFSVARSDPFVRVDMDAGFETWDRFEPSFGLMCPGP